MIIKFEELKETTGKIRVVKEYKGTKTVIHEYPIDLTKAVNTLHDENETKLGLMGRILVSNFIRK